MTPPDGVSRGPQFANLQKITDPRGNLTPIEESTDIPFVIQRVYWIYDVPGGAARGGHAYRRLQEFFVSLSGSFDLTIDDGRGGTIRHTLNRSYYGIYVPAMMWRKLENFSTNALCLILASEPYDEGDYVREYTEYCELVASFGR